MLTLERATQLLRQAPGPSPWFVPALTSQRGALTWSDDDGLAVLRDHAGKIRLVLSMYTYSMALSPHCLLLWYETETHHTFHVVDVDNLDEVMVEPTISLELKERRRRFLCSMTSALAPPEALSLPKTLGTGTHSIDIDSQLLSVSEMAFFSDQDDTPKLWIVSPGTHTVMIRRQNWLAGSVLDRGYQWPVRVVRDPESQEFVGDGIRMGVFVIDETGAQLVRWVLQDRFWMPRSTAAS